MDSKYLDCDMCQNSEGYCLKHQIEIKTNLRKREIMKTLQHNPRSPQFKHAIIGLLQSYDVLQTCHL